MNPGFQVGPIFINYYGLILMSGALAAVFLAEREARRKGIDPELVWDGFVWALVGGIIGARLWHIFTPPASSVAVGRDTMFYLTHPLDAIWIKAGGLGIPGAVIGGGLALYWFARRRRVRFAELVDAAAPGLPLAQAIGRWGNFVNQELYGLPSNLPWAISIDPAHRLPEFAEVERYHPLFLYESIWNLALAILILWLARRRAAWLKTGDLFLVYLIGYPVGRFWLEFLRLDTSQVVGLNANQTFMALVAIAAAGLLIWRHRSSAVVEADGPDDAAGEG